MRSRLLRFVFFVILCALCFSVSAQIQVPSVIVQSVAVDVDIAVPQISDTLISKVYVAFNEELFCLNGADSEVQIKHIFNEKTEVNLYCGSNLIASRTVDPIPLWLSILPPLIAILMALFTKEVYSSLFVGLLVGTSIIWKYQSFSIFVSISKGFLSVVDTYVMDALFNSDHLSIIVFSLLIGGMVALISLNGGMQGIVDVLSRYAKGPRSGQFITWLMGVLIFFDDYANTLIVGSTMRPVTDRLKISREKLAYIVDSTSAPIAAIAFITTWIGAELSYIKEGLVHLGLSLSPYQVFLESLKYAFYPLFTLVFVLLLIWKQKDFGPMFKAEERARNSNGVFNTSHLQYSPQITKEFVAKHGNNSHWLNAVIPVFVVVLGTLVGLAYTGWDADVWQNETFYFIKKISITLGAADSFKALIWSSLMGVTVALLMTVGQKILSLKDSVDGLINGFKIMFNAILILTLAWGIALITQHLHTAMFITNLLLVFKISPYLVPAMSFVFSAVIAFSTGSSWGTMAIIYPLVLPASWHISMEYGLEAGEALPVFYNVVSTVLAGSVFGAHCSPISDTTILSSLSSSCQHVSHVRTQLPYAIVVGTVSLFFGTLPVAYGLPTGISVLLGVVVLYYVVIKVGRKVN